MRLQQRQENAASQYYILRQHDSALLQEIDFNGEILGRRWRDPQIVGRRGAQIP
jgi:hypothetical protein